jgi:hypothetical protein
VAFDELSHGFGESAALLNVHIDAREFRRIGYFRTSSDNWRTNRWQSRRSRSPLTSKRCNDSLASWLWDLGVPRRVQR